MTKPNHISNIRIACHWFDFSNTYCFYQQFIDVFQITDMLLLSAGTEADDVMVALCINLALNKTNAQQMADNSRLHSLMSRALSNQDALIMKMIRNISEHDCTRTCFIVSDFCYC